MHTGPVVPIELRDDPDEPGAAEAYVVAKVAGREYRLMLDTGGARSTLPLDDLTSTFARADVDEEPGRGGLGPASADTARVVVPSIALGPLEVRDLVVDLAPDGSGAPAILGLDVLRGHRLELRLADGMLGIDTDAAVDAERPLPLSSRSHQHVVVGWGDVEATALFDTGASATVVDAAFAAEHSELLEPLPASTGIDAAGNRAETPTARMAACEVGGRRFDASLAVIVPIRGIQRAGDPDFDLILGLPVIRQADWIIDLARGVWAFAGVDRRVSASPRSNTFT
jgi:predicted aspartyl protease